MEFCTSKKSVFAVVFHATWPKQQSIWVMDCLTSKRPRIGIWLSTSCSHFQDITKSSILELALQGNAGGTCGHTAQHSSSEFVAAFYQECSVVPLQPVCRIILHTRGTLPQLNFSYLCQEGELLFHILLLYMK